MSYRDKRDLELVDFFARALRDIVSYRRKKLRISFIVVFKNMKRDIV